MDTEEKLTALFEALGAPSPAGWARSQLSQGIPQLERFLFLRAAWREVVRDGDTSWVDRFIADALRHPNAPYAGVGLALARLRKQGACDEDIAEVIRGMQAELLFSFCYLLDDPGMLEPEVDTVGWALFAIDADGQPLYPIQGLHESVLETDPTGREMRPK